MKVIIDFSPLYCPNCGSAIKEKILEPGRSKITCVNCGLDFFFRPRFSVIGTVNQFSSEIQKKITGGKSFLRKIPSSLAIILLGIIILSIFLFSPDLFTSGNPLIGLVIFLGGLLVIFIFPSRQP